MNLIQLLFLISFGEQQLKGILAKVVEKSDYATAFVPAIKVIEVNQEINQHGYSMILERVEVTETENTCLFKNQK